MLLWAAFCSTCHQWLICCEESTVHSWSSLVEVNEWPDWANSQTWTECCHACAEKYFLCALNRTAYHWANTRLKLLLLESSMFYLFFVFLSVSHQFLNNSWSFIFNCSHLMFLFLPLLCTVWPDTYILFQCLAF